MQVNNTSNQQPVSQTVLDLINKATTNSNTPGLTVNADGTTSTTTTKDQAKLDQNEFMTLMLAQLKNQDPTQPIDSSQFLGQLAQMSQVQGLAQLNDSFSTLATSLTSNQALQASSLLGRNALVSSSTATLGSSGSVSGAVDLPQASGQVVLNITDASGQIVQQVNMGSQPAGLATFTWDGKNLAGQRAAAGTYTLSAAYAGANNTATSAPTLISAPVQSVTMGAGSTGLTLSLGGVGDVAFSKVRQIS